ncbi:GNAT family N-acetyltransferase [Winogradskyella forsetii]|uniref:GNAT family N-acetyltransferase n=1 Tax=Winogradskyella forsetii TaxID=2686077 RepID=UPI0015BD0B13|nr:GNAT family N-acetyltransferase [Winogradskyella forsetii]
MLTIRLAEEKDIDLYFNWVNDPLVRQNSINSETIKYEDHVNWFSNKIKDPNSFLYLFINEDSIPVGQVMIERKGKIVSLSQSVDRNQRGKKYSSEMLTKASDRFLENHPDDTIATIVKSTNIASLKMSKNSGFTISPPDDPKFNHLVLKGALQNDKDFIIEAKHILKLI